MDSPDFTSHSSTNTPQGQRRPLLIDTDLSFDDYVALLYLIQHNAVDVQAITVCNGVVHPRPGLKNLANLLLLAKRQEIPIAAGPSTPLKGSHAFPGSWRWIMDYVFRMFIPWQAKPDLTISAPELLQKKIRSSPTPVTFLTLGPLTNLAIALQNDPTLTQNIEAIYLCGGALHVSGPIEHDMPPTKNTVSEWNLFIDPLAAKIIFDSGVKIILIPLDVTDLKGPQPLLFSEKAARAMQKSARSSASRLLARVIVLWGGSSPQQPGIAVWDAAAAALLTNPEIGEWQTMRIQLITEPTSLAGQTLPDPTGAYEIQVCVRGNRLAFENIYLNLVSQA